MAKPIAHATYPARIVIDINGEYAEIATFELRIPVHATPGDTYTAEDGKQYVPIHPKVALSDRDIAKGVKKSLRYNHAHVAFAR